MPRRLQVLAGGSRATLAPVKVNDDAHPLEIKTDKFDGLVTVRIKNYAGSDGPADAPYFHDGYGKDVTWSVQFQGRFLTPISADDLLFGNEFDEPIRDSLPYGTSLALRAMKFIDPNLTQDVYADKPWALSPLIATMPRMRVDKLSPDQKWPQFPGPTGGYLQDDVSAVLPNAEAAEALSTSSTKIEKSEAAEKTDQIDQNTKDGVDGKDGKEDGPANNNDAAGEPVHKDVAEDTSKESEAWAAAPVAAKKRVSYFSSQAHRAAVKFTSDDLVAADFAHGMVDFGSLTLQLPTFGLAPAWALTFDLNKYWSGQAVYFVARDHHKEGEEGVFFLVQFSLVDE